MTLLKKINLVAFATLLIVFLTFTFVNGISFTINRDFRKIEKYHQLTEEIERRKESLIEYLSMNELDSLLKGRGLAQELTLVNYGDLFAFNNKKIDGYLIELGRSEESLVTLHEERLQLERDSAAHYVKARELKSSLRRDVDRNRSYKEAQAFFEMINRESKALVLSRDNVHIEEWLESIQLFKQTVRGLEVQDRVERYYDNATLIGEQVLLKEKIALNSTEIYNRYLYIIEDIEGEINNIELEIVETVDLRTFIMHLSTAIVIIIGIICMVIINFFVRKNIVIPIAELDRNLTLLADKGRAEVLHSEYGGELSKLVRSFNRLTRKMNESFNLFVNREEEKYSALERNNIELKKVDLFKTNLIKTITSDLKGPLANIIEEAKRGAEDGIYSSSLKLKVNIDRLLEIVKINTGNMKPNLKGSYIDIFLKNITSRYSELLQRLNLKLELNFPREEFIMAYLDYDKMEQVLENILYYIMKLDSFEENTSLNVTLDNRKESVLIEFQLPEIDFPEKEIVKILIAMGDLKNSVADFSASLDLGVLYVNELVNYMGGTFMVGNVSLNRGLKMGVNIIKEENPVYDEIVPAERVEWGQKPKDLQTVLEMEIARIEAVSSLDSGPADDEQEEEDIKEARVLIVDDDHYILLLIDTYLKTYGYKRIYTARNGKEALEIIESNRIDIILCDISMPFMNGRELLERVVESDKFKNIPFIFITALIDKDVVLEFKKKGAADYLVKPFEEDELMIVVENHLKKYFAYRKTLNMSVHDELTGLYNKRAIYTRIAEELSKREYNDLALIFCDIDHFKLFNDTYGHQLGDRVLAHVGELIRGALRKYDFAGRYGGEEFVIVLADSGEEQALNVAYKLRERLADYPLQHKERRLDVRLSFGIASLKNNSSYLAEELKITGLEELFRHDLPFEAEELESLKERLIELLIKMSDDALYGAKKTRCLNCGFESNKSEDFYESHCSKCGNSNLDIGRDRIMLYSRGAIVPGLLK